MKPEEGDANEKKRFMNISECAEMTGYTQMYIYQMVSKKKIPFLKQNGKLMFDVRVIEKWLLAGSPNIGKLIENAIIPKA